MQKPIEVEVIVPCVRGQQHLVQLRLHNWREWEVVGNTCREATCIQYLSEKPKDLRKKVIERLVRIGSEAVSILVQALEDNLQEREFHVERVPGDREIVSELSYPIRVAACNALGAIKDAQATGALVRALNDDDSKVREAAGRALERIATASPERFVDDIVVVLPDSLSELVRMEITKLLEKAVWILAQRGLWNVLIRALPVGAVRETVVNLGFAAVPALVCAMKDSDWQVRRAAIRALGQIGDVSAVPALVEALRDDWNEHMAVIEALGQIGDASAVPALAKLLKDDNCGVRRAAAKALGQIGDASAVPALAKLLKDDNCKVCHAAAEALGRIGSGSAVFVLNRALNDANWRVRQAAAEALGQTGDAFAVLAVVRLLEDTNGCVS